ncbi:myeloid-associated differentiation marker-like [Myotis daubentonii]|uniref:myeloid-associated differentiation marker-like n=1 Tax=Myotis daubentonii TaxID=98922 RepID=UPI002873A4D8|nr:myeloid-associated differentiation marker-like [Myotis daubentonii]
MLVTMASSSGSPNILGSPEVLCRLLQLLSTCLAFSLVASVDAYVGFSGDWCMFAWCFCFAVTIIIIIVVELGGLQARFPLFWRNFPIIYAYYATLFCFSASIIYPTTYVQFLGHGRTRGHAIAATVFSCIACVAYATEVASTRAQPGKITGYMATAPGLLKVVETVVAGIIFAFISDPYLYKYKPALEWCVAVYAICFILAAVAILMNLFNFTNALPIPFPSFLSGLALLSVLFYASAMVLWPLYQFHERYGGFPERRRDSVCSTGHVHYVCAWDRRLAVAILTATNLLAYVADLVYSAHPVSV